MRDTDTTVIWAHELCAGDTLDSNDDLHHIVEGVHHTGRTVRADVSCYQLHGDQRVISVAKSYSVEFDLTDPVEVLDVR